MSTSRPSMEGPQTGSSDESVATRWGMLLPYVLALLVAVGLMVYAETRSFVWDEGFHLVAAQMILAGKQPYLDFCFPQTPLNAYWNAGWMRVFGQYWRPTHVAATLLSIGTLFLVTQYLLARFPVARWRKVCAIFGMFLVGLSITVVEFGTIAQGYAMCLFTTFAAFRLTVIAIHRRSAWLALWAGVLAGIGAGSSLLCAPVAAVLFIWSFIRNESGNRSVKAVAFALGCVTAFSPVLWLFAQSPHRVFFNVIQYQALFRRVNWKGATTHDVDVLTTWVDSGQTLLLGLLCVGGLVFLAKKSGWDLRVRREFYLCGWISAALIGYISTAHPTFGRYYVVAIPFMATLAAVGLYAAGSRLISPDKPLWPATTLTFLLLVALGREIFNDRDSASWQRYEGIAKKVAEVTPRGAALFADEHIYFLLHLIPPSGMEFSYSHKIQLLPKQEAELHIISEGELKTQVKSGVYSTVQTCNDDRIDDWGLDQVYKHRADITDCSVFWEFKRSGK